MSFVDASNGAPLVGAAVVELQPDGRNVARMLTTDSTGRARIDPGTYRRVSPFDVAARTKILELYEDLARAAPFEGLLFHDED